jgi:hypothetical protein
MSTPVVIIALGFAAGAAYVLRRWIGSAPSDRGIDVGAVSTTWLSERRKDSPAE